MKSLKNRLEALEESASSKKVEVFGLAVSSADLKRAIEQAQGTRFPCVPCAALKTTSQETTL